MKKIIIVLLLFLSSFAQSQDLRTVTIRPTKSWLVDSLLSGRYNVSLFTDYGYKILVNNSKKFQIDSTGIFNYYSGIHNFTNGGNVIFGTTDDYSLKLKTNDSTRIEISNRGDLILPRARQLNEKYGGVIYQNDTTLFHMYTPTNGTKYTNFFFGKNAGNFTLTSTGSGATYTGSYNVGMGTNALKNLTTGYYNFMVGWIAGGSITSGNSNFGMGNFTLANLTTGVGNIALGNQSMNTLGGAMWWNIGIGANSVKGTSTSYTPYNNIGIGNSALTNIRTAQRNVSIGHNSLRDLTTGHANITIGNWSLNAFGTPDSLHSSVSITTGSWNILIGDTVYTSSATSNRELNIANSLYGKDIYTDSVKFGILTSSPNSTFQTKSFATGFVNKTASYYATIHDHTINFTSGNDTLFLPNATQCIGRELVIKNSGTGNCYVVGIVSQTIDGASEYNLPTKFDFVRVQSDGSNWVIVGN